MNIFSKSPIILNQAGFESTWANPVACGCVWSTAAGEGPDSFWLMLMLVQFPRELRASLCLRLFEPPSADIGIVMGYRYRVLSTV